jgi:hypothetical protein
MANVSVGNGRMAIPCKCEGAASITNQRPEVALSPVKPRASSSGPISGPLP